MMQRIGLNRRGQPLIALCLVLAVWTGVRMVMREGAERPLSVLPAAMETQKQGALVIARDMVREGVVRPVRQRIITNGRVNANDRVDDVRVASGQLAPPFLLTSLLHSTNPALAVPPRRREPDVPEREAEPASVPPPGPPPVKDDPRWSGDNWLLLRAGSGTAAQAPGAASYGASQAGAVVRYRLGRGDVHESYGYLRTSLAINAPGRDKELALGFGFRPLARLPLRVLAEARLQDTRTGPMQVRPVATVITELPPQELPLGLRAEAYAQGGYAGGRGATVFYDAQVMIDRALPGVGGQNRDLRIGAGIWSGGQEGAVRFDVGPRASVRLDLGDATPARIALDWRFRVAGSARPGSGPALTVASSF